MSAEELSSATARFYRGRNSGARGSGLGLSIVEAAMATLGGTLTINNRPQGGLEVRLTGFALIPAVERGFAIAGKPTLSIERSYGELGVASRRAGFGATWLEGGQFSF